MKVIIVGAGEVGTGLAETLCLEKNAVVVLDLNNELLKNLSNKFDLMTICGNGASGRILTDAEAQDANLMVAVTESNEVNVLACHTAKTLNPSIRTICRVNDPEFFQEDENFELKSFGIDHMVIPQKECAQTIMDVLEGPNLKEITRLSVAGAVICGFQLNPGSAMVGTQLFSFPRPDLLQRIRVCAIWRRGKLIIPRGKERFNNYDEIYIAGERDAVMSLAEWSCLDEKKVDSIIVGGATKLGTYLVAELDKRGKSVTLLEEDENQAELALKKLDSSVNILHGSITDGDILKEAGVDATNIYLSALRNDESNILSCLLAKRKGAEKVISIINKPDYREIISSMENIDGCFSPRTAALNSIINLIQGENRRIGAILHRISAEVFEMTVVPKSRIVGKTISESACPRGAVFAMIFRGNVIIPATGNQIFQVGDLVVMMGEQQALKKAQGLFGPKSIIGI
jgi:trk system potassium uptake protein TrkA